MSDSRHDFTCLIEFSLRYRIDVARTSFPMFTVQQIQHVYHMSKGQRERMLAERQSPPPAGEVYRNPAQAEKMRNMATDPFNR